MAGPKFGITLALMGSLIAAGCGADYQLAPIRAKATFGTSIEGKTGAIQIQMRNPYHLQATLAQVKFVSFTLEGENVPKRTQTLAFTTQTVTVDRLPAGPLTLTVEALDEAKGSLGASSQQLTIKPGTITAAPVQITLSGEQMGGIQIDLSIVEGTPTPTPVVNPPAGAPPVASVGPFGQDPSQYRLTFNEEFNTYNPQIWNDHIWYERSNPTKNYTVEEGKLKIWPQRDASGKFFNRTIDTDRKFEQQYGYFEMEAKLPRGKGTWPAFWLFAHPGDRRPEIDIMEAYAGGAAPWGYTDANGVSRPTAYAPTVWVDANKRAGYRQYDTKMDLSEGFHKYAVKWEPNRQTFYFDGKEIYSLAVRMPDPKYILVDLWFGSASGQADNSTPQGKGNSFEITYVKAWQFR